MKPKRHIVANKGCGLALQNPCCAPNDSVSCTANTSILCPLWLHLLWLFAILYINTLLGCKKTNIQYHSEPLALL